LLKNSLFNAAGGIIRIGVGFLTIPVLIRLLGIEEYGLWTLASTVISIATLAESGLSTTTTVFISQDLGKQDFKGANETLFITIGMMLLLSTIAAFLLWLGSDFISSSLFRLEENQYLRVTESLKIGGLIAWSKMLQQVLIGAEQAYQRYPAMNLFITIQSIATNIGMVTVAYLGGKTVAITQWYFFVNIIILSIHVLFVFSLIDKNKFSLLSWNQNKLKIISLYSMKTWLGSLGSVLFGQFDKIIVSYLLGAKVLGVYAAITSLTSQINSFSAILVQPLLPVISGYFASDSSQREDGQKQIKIAFQLNVIIAFAMGLIMLAAAPAILSSIMKDSYDSQYITSFQLAIFIYSVYSCNAIGYYILLATNATKEFLVIILSTGVISLFLIYLGGKQIGLNGAILGNSGYLLTWVLVFAGMKKIKIDNHIWMQWIKYPFLWFIVTSALIHFMVVYDLAILKWAILACSLLLTSYWFLISNNLKIPQGI
jgi:O-antigen/teichoic acid export membrane protein